MAQPAVTGHTDPDGEAPWAMQIVVHAEKNTTRTVDAVVEAVAVAVATMMCDPRSTDPLVWGPLFDRWLAGRIRKIVRRARGSAWTKVCDLDGIVVEVDGVSVFVAVPGPTDQVPDPIARTQVSGLSATHDDPCTHVEPDGSVVVSVNPQWSLHEHPGKLAAQAAHATQLTVSQMDAERRARWVADGFQTRIEWPDATRWAALAATVPVVIRDAGFTVLPEPGDTVCARWT